MSGSATRRRRLLTDAERAEIVSRLRAGEAIGGVAARFRVDRGTVRRLGHRASADATEGRAAREVIAGRVTTAEALTFDAMIARAGYRSRSEALRALIRMSAGFLELSREENAQLDAVTRQLHKIGVNVNQMARLANSGRLPMDVRARDQFRELRCALGELHGFLAKMNRERRRQGVELYRQSLEQPDG